MDNNENKVVTEPLKEVEENKVVTEPPKEVEENKNSILIVVGIILFVLALAILLIYLLKKPKVVEDNTNVVANTNTVVEDNTTIEDNTTVTDNTTIIDNTTVEENTTVNEKEPQTIKDVVVNDVLITFPATKESFANTGWKWDEKYATKDLASRFTTTGGRIGKFPGGVVVGITNLSDETKKFEDCTIDSGTFYNPKGGKDKVTFIGGLTFANTFDEVSNKMIELGFKNPRVTKLDRSGYLKYYLNDNKDNYKDYIEFYFFDDAINSVTISSSVR